METRDGFGERELSSGGSGGRVSIDRFEIDARPTSAANVKHIYVRDKKARNMM